MPAEITIVGMYEKVLNIGAIVINTTSKAKDALETQLSPFYLGPCDLYDCWTANNIENAWQFSKVYEKHIDDDGDPTLEYFKWAGEGWGDDKAHRYPMGKGAVPKYSLWDGKKLGYIDARKQIYAPLYAEAVQKTEMWTFLKWLYQKANHLILRDYDGYRHRDRDMSLTDVLNDPRKKMGHAFVLAMLLTKDPALKEIDLRK